MKCKPLILIIVSLSLLSLLFASTPNSAPANTKSQTLGANSYGNETLDTLSSVGLVKLSRTVITEHLSINGSLIAQGANIGSIDIVGEANLTDTTIQNGGTILGSLQTQRTKIDKPLIINGQKALFSSSQLKGLTIRLMDGFKGKQIIELRHKSVVDGPITFESGKGEVHLYSGSQVLGPVSGGKIVKK